MNFITDKTFHEPFEPDTRVEPGEDHWLMQWVEQNEEDFSSVEVDDFILID